ncbi:MAG: PH domain-containing protein [Mycobacteriaceae bacterium]|uniref:PH domain-containing protein n=1 Tax=Corynebacterium sp. TaxID=1720 RepID=UPI003F96C12E
MTGIMPTAWSRLSSRVIWVDLALTVLSLVPALVAIAITRASATNDVVWPLIAIAAFGVIGAVGDLVRWMFTRYRVSDSHIELRTGVIVKQRRSLRRGRIRSVDIEAKLRHRLSGLRMVKIGAGQQAAAGESAFTLDALSREDALALQSALLSAATPDTALPDDGTAPDATPGATDEHVFATMNPRWVIYNMFNIWAYLLALGVIGGAWGITSMVGVDLAGLVSDLYDWGSLGWLGIAVVVVVGVTLLGWVGLTLSFFTEFWRFELARVPGPEGTQLRTRQGLFTTREVNRDENRVRGVQIAEPLFWRWLRVTDTHVITTGLDVWSLSDPAAILPRVHRDLARRTAAEVLGETASLFDVPLRRHPQVALARRLWWATLLTLAMAAVLGAVVYADLLPTWALWSLPVVWSLCLAGAFIAYRALGHAEVGPYLIIRFGLFSRATVILRRDAVSTIAVRESVLQKWLGLRTITVATAAGYGGYDIPDVASVEATELADASAPGLLDGFTVSTNSSEATAAER